MIRRETARYHTVASTLVKRSSQTSRRIYVLYILTDDEGSSDPMLPLVKYILENASSRSLAWQRELCRAVGLFIDFIKSNQQHFKSQLDRPQLLAEFAEVLIGGTIELDGTDSSGLFWTSKTNARAKLLLTLLTGFSDWLVQRYDTKPINPWRTASYAEQIAYWRRFDERRAHALLAHTFDREAIQARSKFSRTVAIRQRSLVHETSTAKHFPEEKLNELLTNGFLIRGNQRLRNMHENMHVRDIMITMLLQGGGLRESEPFHLYVSDVLIDPQNPKSAMVRLYHPQYGSAPHDYIDPLTGKVIPANRDEYLRVKWGLQPRNTVQGRFHAGWKDLKLSDGKEKYALIHWFPTYWGEAFLILFKNYIMNSRSRHALHPYLFVSAKEDVKDAPYTIGAYRQLHGKAVRRIGLIPSKNSGTTPHGHRHAYAQSMTDAGISSEVIQAALHHKSPESQQIYKEASVEKTNRELRNASAKLSPTFISPSPWNPEA